MPHCTCWQCGGGCTAPRSPLLRTLDTHAAAVMLAATLMIIAIIAATATLPVAVCTVLLVGALCQLSTLPTATQRLRHVLLALGSMLQFIAMALLTQGAAY